MTMIPRERIPFTPIVDRPAMKVPNNGRIIVWSIVNLEVWDIARPMARQMVNFAYLIGDRQTIAGCGELVLA